MLLLTTITNLPYANQSIKQTSFILINQQIRNLTQQKLNGFLLFHLPFSEPEHAIL